MKLTGKNIIGSKYSKKGSRPFYGVNPTTDEKLPTAFAEATLEEIDTACIKADRAFITYSKKGGKEKAGFLEEIANEILSLGETLIARAHEESGLPMGRLTGERGRTVGQLRLFATLLREGSWVRAKIDPAQPERQPNPRADIRQMQIALGPVGIFGASNFPLAFSVAGGDTAAALAAGCSVVIKGHPAHPGTSELVGRAIINAARKTGMPDGVCSLIQGISNKVGLHIVKHPNIKAIGFTGSYKGGKAIYDAACRRPHPIPVYAEMGSTNPVFILPDALKKGRRQLAQKLRDSVTLGVGQFCTNPGLVVVQQSGDTKEFIDIVGEEFNKATSGTMLTKGICDNYKKGSTVLLDVAGVSLLGTGDNAQGNNQGVPQILTTNASHFLKSNELSKENFGPSSIMVMAKSKRQLLQIAEHLEGHLTATIHGSRSELKEYADLIDILQRKVGRLIINGFPTGVEVGHAMVHGGPFPATTDPRMTSVGTEAITRFTRPFCYQDFPDTLLPPELKNKNPLNIWRQVDGAWEK